MPVGSYYAWLGCPVGVDLGPGHISFLRAGVPTVDYWVLHGNSGPGLPETYAIRLNVTDATTELPMAAGIFVGWGPDPGVSLITERVEVWDGTGSTGVQQVAVISENATGLSFMEISVFPVDPDTGFPITTESPIQLTWTLEAVDVLGNEVGFDACG